VAGSGEAGAGGAREPVAAGRWDDDVLDGAGHAGDDTIETVMMPTIAGIVSAVTDPRRRTRHRRPAEGDLNEC